MSIVLTFNVEGSRKDADELEALFKGVIKTANLADSLIDDHFDVERQCLNVVKLSIAGRNRVRNALTFLHAVEDGV